ncbi:MAG: DNA-binding protein [Luteimonas sp.]
MTDYEFTLKFSLPDSGADPDQHMEALAAAGCDDALIGIGQRGRIVLDFTRSAKSAFAAISTALRDVRVAIPQAVLVEASPDFVGLTDVADIAGFTRQNMRKLMISNSSTFPVAVHEGKPALWHLATILAWLDEQQGRRVDAVLLEVAKANMTLNIAKETHKLPGAVLPKELELLFA